MKLIVLFVATTSLTACGSLNPNQPAPSTTRIPKHFIPHESVTIASISRIVCQGDDWCYLAKLSGPHAAQKRALLHFGSRALANSYDPNTGVFDIYLPSSMQPLIVSKIRANQNELNLYYSIQNGSPKIDQADAYVK